MHIANSSAVQSATAAVANSSQPAEAANIAVLKKALDTQTATANTLLQALPQPPALASSGSLGTKVNTFA